MAKPNLLNSVKVVKNGYNAFDLSHDVKLSFDMGNLIPTMCLDVIPGDKIDLSCEAFVRFAPMLTPVMHRFDVSSHYFFVPKRILWDGFEKFMRNGSDDGTGVPAWPYLTVNDGDAYTALMDYLGIPPFDGAAGGNADQTNSINVSAMPFAAYQMIWQEYFRDQNMDPNTIFIPLVNGTNMANYGYYTGIRKRCWEHDYLTSALPFAQRGPSVEIPIANFNDVPVRVNDAQAPGTAGFIDVSGANQPINADTPNVALSANDGFFAETSLLNANATTINDLRRATKLQEWFERMAVAGARYAEQLWAFFNVRNQDARLQRPEYIVGLKSPVTISEVLNTTGTDDAPQGNMAGHGVSVQQGRYGHYEVKEHGYIICIMSVMPKTAYQQGIPKHFLKVNDFTEHYWPQFANIGEQEVKQEEAYAYGPLQGDTFGYTPRYAEYKFENSRVCGQFRTSYSNWHAGRIFTTEPSLNQGFVESNPTKRIFAVTDPTVDSLLAHVLHKVRAVRQMPKFGTPSL